MDVDSSASKTALMVCAYRARASRWPKPLFVDPWAEQIAGSDGHAIAKNLDAITNNLSSVTTWLNPGKVFGEAVKAFRQK